MPLMPAPSLAHAFDVEVELGPLEDHGRTRVGHRRVVPITGGSVNGRIEGELLPGGADWQVVRPDGVVEVDARYSVRLAAGGLVLLHARGVRAGSPEVLEALLRGDDVVPSEYSFRTVVTVETAAPGLAWAQDALFLAAAVRRADSVAYSAYQVG